MVKFIVKFDKNLELKQWNKFFFKYNIHMKNMILQFFRTFKDIETEEELEKRVMEVIEWNKDKINNTILEIQNEIDSNSEAFKIVENILGEEYSEDEIAIFPTLLNFSPHGPDNWFQISIAGKIFNNRIIETIPIAVHEFCHLLYYQKIRRLFNIKDKNPKIIAEKLNIDFLALDSLKEIYAPIIMNHKSLKKFFPNHIPGNNEYSIIKVQFEDIVMSIEDYFIREHQILENKGLSKDDIEKEILSKMGKIGDEVANKIEMFNNSNRDEQIQKGIFNPIIIT